MHISTANHQPDADQHLAEKHIRQQSHDAMTFFERFYKFPSGACWTIALHIGAMFRKRKFAYFMRTFSPSKKTKILDVGAYGGIGQTAGAINYLEKWYPWKNKLTALGMDNLSLLKKTSPEISIKQYDGRRFPFSDQEFDIAFSNAVIEHAGSRTQQQFFLDEMLRVAQRVFIATPNRWFFLEPHTLLPFLHWLPASIHRPIFARFGFPEWATEKNLNALTPLSVHALLKNYKGKKQVQVRWSLWNPNIVIAIR